MGEYSTCVLFHSSLNNVSVSKTKSTRLIYSFGFGMFYYLSFTKISNCAGDFFGYLPVSINKSNQSCARSLCVEIMQGSYAGGLCE